MIKLSASVSKKVPVPDVEFSSRSYSAGMEVELSSGAPASEIKKKLSALYALLDEAIEEQIRDGQGKKRYARAGVPSEGRDRPKERTNRNNRGNGRMATKAQLRAIHAIAKEHGYSEQDLQQLLSGSFGVEKTSALSIGDASALIDALRGNGKEGDHED